MAVASWRLHALILHRQFSDRPPPLGQSVRRGSPSHSGAALYVLSCWLAASGVPVERLAIIFGGVTRVGCRRRINAAFTARGAFARGAAGWLLAFILRTCRKCSRCHGVGRLPASPDRQHRPPDLRAYRKILYAAGPANLPDFVSGLSTFRHRRCSICSDPVSSSAENPCAPPCPRSLLLR